MCLLQLFQFLVVFAAILLHLSIFQLLFQGFGLSLESLGLNVLPFAFALFLLAYCLLSDLETEYMASQS